MPTVALVALKLLHYNGRNIRAGVVFQANPDHARMLKALGRAKDPDPPKSTYRTRALAPDDEPEPELVSVSSDVDGESVEGPRKKRQYRRRDLTAEAE